MPHRLAHRSLVTATGLALLGWAGHAQAAFLSELFILSQPGPLPPVQGVELSGVDDGMGVTLALLNGSRFDATGFGQVLDLIHLPANSGWAPTVLLADQPWPDAADPVTPLADVGTASGSATFNLGGSNLDRLLVVFDGETDLIVGDNPLRTDDAAGRYDATAVTDWLAIGPSAPTDLATGYVNAGYDINGPEGINVTLGIDLLARTADRSAGQVIARALAPGGMLDLHTAWVGDPDVNDIFLIDDDFAYRATPGVANVPLISIPEPGSAALWLASSLLMGRRRRPRC